MTIAQEEFKNRMLALDENEKRMALKLFPDHLIFEELERRNRIQKEKLKRISEELKISE